MENEELEKLKEEAQKCLDYLQKAPNEWSRLVVDKTLEVWRLLANQALDNADEYGDLPAYRESLLGLINEKYIKINPSGGTQTLKITLLDEAAKALRAWLKAKEEVNQERYQTYSAFGKMLADYNKANRHAARVYWIHVFFGLPIEIKRKKKPSLFISTEGKYQRTMAARLSKGGAAFWYFLEHGVQGELPFPTYPGFHFVSAAETFGNDLLRSIEENLVPDYISEDSWRGFRDFRRKLEQYEESLWNEWYSQLPQEVSDVLVRTTSRGTLVVQPRGPGGRFIRGALVRKI